MVIKELSMDGNRRKKYAARGYKECKLFWKLKVYAFLADETRRNMRFDFMIILI